MRAPAKTDQVRVTRSPEMQRTLVEAVRNGQRYAAFQARLARHKQPGTPA